MNLRYVYFTLTFTNIHNFKKIKVEKNPIQWERGTMMGKLDLESKRNTVYVTYEVITYF